MVEMSQVVKHESGAMVPTSEGPGTALDVRGELSLAALDPEPPATPAATARAGRPGRLVIAVIAAALVAAVAVGAAAFGGTGSGTGAASSAAHGTLAGSASASSAASSVAFTVAATESSPGTTTTLVSGTGAYDSTARVGQLQADIPGLSNFLGGSGSSVSVVVDGSDLYVGAPGLSSLTDGKNWLEFPSSGTGASGGVASSLTALTDPSELLALLGDTGGTVTKVGTVRLDGAPATEYRAVLSLTTVADHLGASQKAAAARQAAAKAIQMLGGPTVPVTVWVGHNGLVRQVTASVDLDHATLGSLPGSAGVSSGSSVDVTVGFSHYGSPVHVSVPPSSEVTNLGGIMHTVQGAATKVSETISSLVSRV
jgi:hypothetical protein